MILAILALGGVALWDSQRESAAALDDFGAEQEALARAVAAVLVEKLADADEPVLVSAVKVVERPGNVLALFQRPGEAGLVTSANEPRRSATLEDALARGTPWVRVPRLEAAGLGLPERLSIAGFASADGRKGTWHVAIVASAASVRDREKHSTYRLVLGFGFGSVLIAAFGFFAERKRKRELELARSLALAEASQLLDERLVRADKLATLGALATGIAHEVSTPLGVIVGRAEQLLPRVGEDERARAAVRAIGEQAERITSIIRAFLRLARGGTPTLERVAPGALAGAAVELVEHRFTKASVALEAEIAAGLPQVACDPKLFEQVLVNLLLNACDACAPDGAVRLVVTNEDDRVAFTVLDDGEGITPAIQQRATEPFFTTKAEDAGTGLGLAIASEIVKHHHGELTLAPRSDGHGTRATVLIATAARENDDRDA